MKTIEATGKKLDDAIKNGLAELGVTLDDVDVEILESGGWFKKAKVRLTVIEDDEIESIIKKEEKEEVEEKVADVKEEKEEVLPVEEKEEVEEKEKFKKKKSNEIIENKLEDNEEQILKEEKVKKKINKKQIVRGYENNL